jgi:hypothetical protein
MASHPKISVSRHANAALRENVSWWVGADRDEFAARRREKEREMRESRFGHGGTVYANLSDCTPRPRSADKEFAPRPRFE